MDFQILDAYIIEAKVKEKITNRPKYKNCFLTDFADTDLWENGSTLVIRKKYETFNRIYFLSDNADDLINALSQLGKCDIINIPSKKGISEELLKLLAASDYSLFEVYERMYNNEVDSRGGFDAELADLKDVDGLYDIMLKTFNPFTDTLPSKKEIKDLIDKRWILVNRNIETGAVEGALLLRFEEKKCYYYIWVNSTNFNESLYLFLNGFNYMKQKGYKKAYLWVRSTNKRPRKLYETLGFKFDGLKDYTFTKG